MNPLLRRPPGLLAFLVFSVLAGCGGEDASEVGPVTVYCFHGDERCEQCDKIENWTAEALQEDFADALEQGRVRWEVVNFQAPGNERFVEPYGIITTCIVLEPSPGDLGNDDHRNLQQQVWSHATSDDRAGLKRLITAELRPMLGP